MNHQVTDAVNGLLATLLQAVDHADAGEWSLADWQVMRAEVKVRDFRALLHRLWREENGLHQNSAEARQT